MFQAVNCRLWDDDRLLSQITEDCLSNGICLHCALLHVCRVRNISCTQIQYSQNYINEMKTINYSTVGVLVVIGIFTE